MYTGLIRACARLVESGAVDKQAAVETLCDAANEIDRLRARCERLKLAIEFARSEGFQWLTDPMKGFY